ncbi:MAG: ABC transporter ATP-binding protein [bacterium]
MITFRNVTRRFGSVEAVKNLNFEVQAGDVVGLLGANGAGKTTTMRLMTGYYAPSEGEVRVGDEQLQRNPLSIKRRIGYLPETPPLYDEMILDNYLRYVGRLKEITSSELPGLIDKVLNRLELQDQRDRLIGNLSRGYRQRVALAQALVHEPDILVLDEPTLGLDPKQVSRLRDLIQELAEDSTLLISSHILPEVREICERVIILKDGEMVAVDTPERLALEMAEGHPWTLKVKTPPDNWLDSIRDLSTVRTAEQTGDGEFQIVFDSDDEKGRTELFDLCQIREVPILELSQAEFDLEDIFLELTQEEKGPEQPVTKEESTGGSS